VNYFLPAYCEARRIVLRAVHRWELRGAEKRLAKAETELGLLGWQQADFDEETQRDVDKIMNFEREQARLTNESATVGRAIGELNTLREQTRRTYREKRTPLQAQLEMHRANLAKFDADLAKAEDELPDLERRAAQLERELRETNELYTEMLSREPESREQRDEFGRVRERIVSLPHEISDAHLRQSRLQREIEARRKTRAKEEERAEGLARDIRQLDDAHRHEDEELAEGIKTREREKHRLEKEHDALEHEKANPYRRIGEVLADSHVAPMNQPQALDVVRDRRFRVHELQYEISKSLNESKLEDPVLIHHSLILWAAIIIAVLLIFGALFSLKW
jgi:chromosome segregation ATPase